MQAGRATRQGRNYYCAECSPLVLDSVATAAAPRKAARAPVAHGLGAHEMPSERPTAKQAEPINDGIEVLEEFEIMSVDVPDAAPKESPMADSEPVASEGRASSRRRASGRAGAGAGRGASQRKMAAASSRRGAARASGRAAASEDSSKGSNRQKKEVFYRSGSNKAVPADQVGDVHENLVDSNVLQAINLKKDQKRKANSAKNIQPASRGSARSNASASSRSNSGGSGRSQRMSRRGGKGGGSDGGNQTLMIAGGAGLLLMLILVFAMSGSSTGTRSQKQSHDEAMPASFYASKAAELERQGNRAGAMDMYIKAAEAAERSGNSSEAVRFNQRAYDIQKFTTLKMNR